MQIRKVMQSNDASSDNMATMSVSNEYSKKNYRPKTSIMTHFLQLHSGCLFEE